MSSSAKQNKGSYSRNTGLPRERYIKAVNKRKKREQIKTFFVTAFELILISSVVVITLMYNVPLRAVREVENNLRGSVSLATGRYFGDTDFGLLSGEGQFNFDSGSVYSGSWKDNAMEGPGSLVVPSSGNYIGDFLLSEKNGHGIFTWDDGTIYDGEWKNDRMDGQGIYTSSNGAVYTGTFRDNALYQGTCTFTNDSGKYELDYQDGHAKSAVIQFADGTNYSGECSESTINGKGRMAFRRGDIYEGQFSSGVRNGTGEYEWASGDHYSGAWADDKMSGNGTYSFADGSILKGEFIDNSFSKGTYDTETELGKYVYSFENRRPVQVQILLSDGSSYTGEMNKYGLNGKAVIVYSNGDVYGGDVKSARKNGYGEYKWASGAKYTGNWADDQMNGKGTYEYPPNENGYKLVGNFVSGVPDGECDYYSSIVDHCKTTWVNGKCVKVTE